MGTNVMNLLLLVGFIAIIYFMMIRPQKKKEKADKAMRDALAIGDEIITIGGVVGKVVKITDKTVIISTGAAQNKIEFLKSAIASVSSSKKAPAKKASKKAEPAEEEVEVKAVNRDKKVSAKKLVKKDDEPAEEEKAVIE